MDDQIQESAETTEDDDFAVTPEMEEEQLRARAAQLGLRVSPKAKLETLRAKVNAAMNGEKDDEDEKADTSKMSEAQRKMATREKMKREQLRLVRVRIANHNPDKSDLPGEIFSVANKYLGTVKKFIPYGEATDNGYHVPVILLNQLKSRKFLQKKTKQNRQTGNIDLSTRWVSEFSIEELEPLTQKELDKLAASQAAAQGLDT